MPLWSQVIRLLLNEQKAVARDPANPQSTYTYQVEDASILKRFRTLWAEEI